MYSLPLITSTWSGTFLWCSCRVRILWNFNGSFWFGPVWKWNNADSDFRIVVQNWMDRTTYVREYWSCAKFSTFVSTARTNLTWIPHHKNGDSFHHCTFYSPPLLVYWPLDISLTCIKVIFDIWWQMLLGGEYCRVCSSSLNLWNYFYLWRLMLFLCFLPYSYAGLFQRIFKNYDKFRKDLLKKFLTKHDFVNFWCFYLPEKHHTQHFCGTYHVIC